MNKLNEAEKTENVANSAATSLLDCFVDDQGLQIDGDSLCPSLYWCRVDYGGYDSILEVYGRSPFCKTFFHRLQAPVGGSCQVDKIVIGPEILIPAVAESVIL